MAPCEWVIDIIKDWVLGKDYQSGADIPEWTMPLSVTGVVTPDVTCTYLKTGILNGKPYYRRLNGSYFIWWNGTALWYISTILGDDTTWKFVGHRENVLGDYAAHPFSTGIATVSSGYTYLKTSFVDRGDPAAYDWDHTDLTIDGAWHELDLSGIVPAGAKSVLFLLYVSANAVNKSFVLRKKGNVNTINTGGIVPPVANLAFRGDAVVTCDVDRKIEYRGSAGAFIYIYIVIRNWWF